MFGKRISINIIKSLILIGFCVYIIQLFANKEINLYIHPRYSWFAIIMSLIAVLMLVSGIFFEFKNRTFKNIDTYRINFIDITVFLVLFLAFILPPQPLSQKSIGRKSLNTPNYQNISKNTLYSNGCPESKFNSIEELVNQISEYSVDCFKGQAIEIKGFVIESPDDPLPSDMYYIGRNVISCCVIDARPYAIPINKTKSQNYPKDTWLKIIGKLDTKEVNGTIKVIIEPSKVMMIEPPSNPYDYINVN